MDTISIKDYAALRGISTQAVYKKLKTALFKPYIHKGKDGSICLDVAVLNDEKINGNSTRFATVDNQGLQPLKTPEIQGKTGTDSDGHSTVERAELPTVDNLQKTPVESHFSDVSPQTLNYMSEEIKRLETALQGKEQALKEKDEEIKALNARIADYADKFANLTHEAHQLAAMSHSQKQIEAPGQPKASWWYRFWHSTAPGK